jgi:phospholipid/cholesterol/gamma-HCH transport system substrate-binding protein
VATAETPIPTIQADPGSGHGVFEAGSAALNNANVFISKLNGLLDQNEKAITTTMTNVEQVTTMLAEKKDEIGQAISDVKDGAQSFKSLSSKLEVSLGDNMDGLTRQARESLQEFGSFMREGRRVAVTLNRILEKLEADPKGFLLGGNQLPEYTPKGR